MNRLFLRDRAKYPLSWLGAVGPGNRRGSL